MNLITVNLRELALKDLHVEGELSAAELQMDGIDELIRVSGPVCYDFHASLDEENLLLSGSLSTVLECECGRCLRKFTLPVEIGDWHCLVPLEGEDKVEVINDTVDLTPFVREDTLIEFPLHPQCGEECPGLKVPPPNEAGAAGAKKETAGAKSPWDGLDKLKLD